MRLLRPISCNIERIPPCWIKNAVSRTRADLLPIGLRHSAGTPLLTTGRPDNLETSVRGDRNRRHSSIPSLEGATNMRIQRSRVASWALAVFVAGSLPLASIVGRDARAQEKETPTVGTTERLDPRLDQIVPRDARVERIAEGFDWSEGPVWDRRGGFLLFSDVPRNTVFKWQQGKGVNVFLKPSGCTGTTPRGGEPGSNGLLMDSQGRLILCQHGDRRVARLEASTGRPAGRNAEQVCSFEKIIHHVTLRFTTSQIEPLAERSSRDHATAANSPPARASASRADPWAACLTQAPGSEGRDAS